MSLFKKTQEIEPQIEKEETPEELEKIQQQKKDDDNFINGLTESLNNNIICLTTYDTRKKQIALNYLLTHGFVCVQNDVNSSYHILTFAREDYTKKFYCKGKDFSDI